MDFPVPVMPAWTSFSLPSVPSLPSLAACEPFALLCLAAPLWALQHVLTARARRFFIALFGGSEKRYVNARFALNVAWYLVLTHAHKRARAGCAALGRPFADASPVLLGGLGDPAGCGGAGGGAAPLYRVPLDGPSFFQLPTDRACVCVAVVCLTPVRAWLTPRSQLTTRRRARCVLLACVFVPQGSRPAWCCACSACGAW